MFTATNSTTASATAISAYILCERCFIGASIGFLEIDKHDIDRQEQRDQRGEIDEVAQIDHARGNSLEVGQEAEPGNRVHQHDRRPDLEDVKHQGRARY